MNTERRKGRVIRINGQSPANALKEAELELKLAKVKVSASRISFSETARPEADLMLHRAEQKLARVKELLAESKGSGPIEIKVTSVDEAMRKALTNAPAAEKLQEEVRQAFRKHHETEEAAFESAQARREEAEVDAAALGLILASRMGAMPAGTELRMLPRNADYEAGFLAGFAYARTYSRRTPSKLDLQRQRELTEMAQARVAGDPR